MAPRADDRAVAGPGAAAAAEGVVDERLDLALAAAGARGAHGRDVRLGGDLRGAAQDGELAGRLDEAHLVQRQARVDEAHRRAPPAPLAGAQPAEQAADRRVLLRLAAERVVDLLGARDDLGQLVVELVAGEARRRRRRSLTAPSTPARRPVQVSAAGSRGRTNSTNGVACPGRSSTAAPGSSNPVRYRMSLSWRYL